MCVCICVYITIYKIFRAGAPLQLKSDSSNSKKEKKERCGSSDKKKK